MNIEQLSLLAKRAVQAYLQGNLFWDELPKEAQEVLRIQPKPDTHKRVGVVVLAA